MFEIAGKNYRLRLARAVHVTAAACILGAGSVGTGGAARAADCQNTPEGRVCKVQQPITAGTVVNTDTQRELGLVTVNGGCSGTLITQFLVLTARHCVTINGEINGPLNHPADIRVTATWASGTARVHRIEDFKKNTARNDIILVRLGFPNFGRVNAQRVYAVGVRSGSSVKLSGRLKSTDVVTQYGRGFSTFASGTFGTPSATAATGDGIYRSAQFTPSSIDATSYELTMNGNSQVGHGGDSGGPSWVTVGGFNQGIAGVQSTCRATGHISGTPKNQEVWRWATGASACQYVSTEPYLGEISDAKREVPPDYTALCTSHAARQFARVAEARRLGCPFLTGSGGWNKDQAAFENTCLNMAGTANQENERGLQANLDSCLKAKGLTISTGKACMDFAERMVQNGKKVVGTKCEPLSNFKTRERWFTECNEGMLRLPGRLPYDMNFQAQAYEGNMQNCLQSLKAGTPPPPVVTAPPPPAVVTRTVAAAVTMYDKPENGADVCHLRANDKVTVLAGSDIPAAFRNWPDKTWIAVSGAGGDCSGKRGGVYNDGKLR